MSTRKITTESLDNYHKELLFKASDCKIVFVEGEDDKIIFEHWFKDNLSDIYFEGCTGGSHVKSRYDAANKTELRQKVYGIVDRDYKTQEEVNNSKLQGSKYFITEFSELENYLLHPNAILDIYSQPLRPTLFSTDNEVEEELLNTAKKCIFIICANRLLNSVNPEEKKYTYAHELHDNDTREKLKKFLDSKKLNADGIDNLIDSEIELIENSTNSLNETNKYFDGKRLFYQFTTKNKIGHIDGDLLKSLLIKSILTRNLVHNDLKSIRDLILNKQHDLFD